MSTPQQASAPVGEGLHEAPPVRREPAVILCRDCRHWDRRWPQANHAQCLKAMAYGSSPLMTTDLQTCSQAEAKRAPGAH